MADYSGLMTVGGLGGALGIGFQYGAAKGALAAAQEARDQGTFDMQKEAFGWKRDEVEKEKALQAGMVDAAKDGGYNGVIAYLEKADPERALKFTDAKLSLDDHILTNDVAKATADYKKKELLMDSYGLLGKMGASILAAPEADRDTMYQSLLPIAQKINPQMPSDLQSAVPIFMLSIAQSTPANQLFGAQKDVLSSQSYIGGVDVDIKDRLAKGVSIDDPGLQALMAERDRALTRNAAAQAQYTRAQLGVTKDQMQATETVSKNLQTASKDFTNFSDSYTSIQAALSTLAQNPDSPVAQAALGRSFVMGYNKGAVSETDAKLPEGTTGAAELEKKLRGLMTGQIVRLNPNEIANVAQLYENLKDQKLNFQKEVESQFQQSTSSYGSLVDWANVRKPSDQFTQYQQQQANQQQAAAGSIPPDLQQAMQVAKQRGYSDQQINTIVQNYMQTQGQAGRQQGQVQMNAANYGIGQNNNGQ